MSNIIRTIGLIISVGLLIIGLGLIVAGIPGSPLANNPIKINFEKTYYGIESAYHSVVNHNKNIQHNNYNIVDSIHQNIIQQQRISDMNIKNAKQMQDASDTIWRIQQDNDQRMYDIKQWQYQSTYNNPINPTYNNIYNNPAYGSAYTYRSFP